MRALPKKNIVWFLLLTSAPAAADTWTITEGVCGEWSGTWNVNEDYPGRWFGSSQQTQTGGQCTRGSGQLDTATVSANISGNRFYARRSSTNYTCNYVGRVDSGIISGRFNCSVF